VSTPDIFKVQRLIGAHVDGIWGGESERLLDQALAKIEAPLDLARFFNGVRQAIFNGRLTEDQVTGCEAILSACAGWPINWKAYALATAFHETAATMQPVAEYGKGRGRPYGQPIGHGGQVPYGRGYVQLTWPKNYETMDEALGLGGALIKDYDLAMRPDIAAKIMRVGMERGLFTGKKMADYLNQSPPNYVDARRIINSLDRAELIAGYAKHFERSLS
jgi:hypothetical protein